MQGIAENIKTLRDEIHSLAIASGRRPEEVLLIAVSKTKPASDILTALQAGQIDFGENYAQEFHKKNNSLLSHPMSWHFIGHLQSNKAKYVVGKSALIHTVDRLSLAKEIQRLCEAKQIMQDVLIEVKLATENTKAGCAPADLKPLLIQIATLSRVRVKGLMTVGSLTRNPTKTREEFRQLRILLEEINAKKIYPTPLTELSMGMSSDYGIAIAEGATLVRIGSRIFGNRP